MALASLSSLQLRQLIRLVKEKETLQAKLNRVSQALLALENGGTGSSVPARTRRRRRRSSLQEAILPKLQAAGKTGLSVQELSAALSAKPASVSVWLYTTGKKIKGIKKIGRGRFAFVS